MAEVEHNNYNSHEGKINAGLTTGIIGTALGALNGGFLNGGGLFGNNMNRCACSDEIPVTRYEAAMQNKIAEQESHIRLLEADKYTDNKMLELYAYVDGKFNAVNERLCQQAVVNAQISANLSCMQQSIAVLNGLTKTVIPIDQVCPTPQPLFNSWTAPATTATTGA